MKKELIVASLMLTSPGVLAQSVPTNQNASKLTFDDQRSDFNWIFEAENYIRIPKYDFDRETGKSSFSHNEVLKVSVHFFPVDSKSDLFDFSLEDFDAINSGEEEYELIFRTENLSKNLNHFEGDSSYYGIKKGNTISLFDCDSTRRCVAGVKNQSFAILKIEKNGTLKFVHKADHFDTPYSYFNYETGEHVDLGSKILFQLKD